MRSLKDSKLLVNLASTSLFQTQQRQVLSPKRCWPAVILKPNETALLVMLQVLLGKMLKPGLVWTPFQSTQQINRKPANPDYLNPKL